MNGIKLYNILLDNNFTKEEEMAFIEHLEGTIDQGCDGFKDSMFITKEDLHQAFQRENGITSSRPECFTALIDRMRYDLNSTPTVIGSMFLPREE